MSDDLLALQREAQTLRLELEAAREQIAQLRGAAGRNRGDDRVADAVNALQTDLMEHLAAPVTQLMTQSHLHDEGKPVAVRDVLNVVKRLVRSLGDAGLTLEGTLGATVGFDVERHEPLGDFHPAAAEPVVVRVAGVVWNGRRLRRAGVGAP